MTTHRHHPDVHTHGLQDGCPRCHEHATNPTRSLDPDMLNELRRRLALNLPARSASEAIAMRRVEHADHP